MFPIIGRHIGDRIVGIQKEDHQTAFGQRGQLIQNKRTDLKQLNGTLMSLKRDGIVV